mmetsp:Transcript_104811/g.323264  ORF Transcript_104811/g.323264 Transcript_104811/m.323264 type:complete len:499 (+) Transcript_104811:73-1569(+)
MSRFVNIMEGRGSVMMTSIQEAQEKSNLGPPWMCTQCGKQNKSQCQRCEACKHMRPDLRVQHVVQRAQQARQGGLLIGRGGGFFQRQASEHKDDLSDDEFDVYGRRRSRRKSGTEATSKAKDSSSAAADDAAARRKAALERLRTPRKARSRTRSPARGGDEADRLEERDSHLPVQAPQHSQPQVPSRPPSQFQPGLQEQERQLMLLQAEQELQEREQQQLQQQCQEMVTGLEVSTPRSSPRAMRINSRAEACEICCNDAPPWRAVRLGCGHGWYCAQCILRHAEARLEVGAASVTCPECSSPLAERDLRKLLPPELIDRLLARSLEQAISSAADLWACPTPNCPMRVALGDGEVPRLRCTLCKKDSCLRCSAQPYHRGMTCEEYAARRRLKGKRQQRDEDSFMQWLKETGTKQCPTCRMGVTKQNLQNQQTQRSECHKMFCRNCNTRFCFKCLAVLTDSYTCGCTIDAHGFINPRTGRRLNHLRRGRVGAKGKGPGNR